MRWSPCMQLEDRDRARLLDMVTHADDAIALLGDSSLDDLRNDLS